jgi:hypothetical protein
MTDQPTGHRPRRDPAAGMPRIAEADRPDPAQVRAQREQATRRRLWNRGRR